MGKGLRDRLSHALYAQLSMGWSEEFSKRFKRLEAIEVRK